MSRRHEEDTRSGAARLHGDGLFSQGDGFSEFLSIQGADCSTPDACGRSFPARSFLLDEGVTDLRRESYGLRGCTERHADFRDWKATHEAYLKERVFVGRDSLASMGSVDPEDELLCPETFHSIPNDSPFLDSDESLDLVRVERARFIADLTSRSEGEVLEMARAAASSPPHSEARVDFQHLMRQLAETTDQRPVFAAFWEDVKHLFGSEETSDGGDTPGWPNRLRDRLGLVHLDPALGGAAGPAGDRSSPRELPIIVFRYPVKDVPGLRGLRGRPLVPPSVLDGRFSVAFCPDPRGSRYGHTVDLGARRPSPAREVLHPSFAFKGNHVWRVGAITTRSAVESLPTARGLHLEALREASGRPSYALGTDGDLT